MAKDDDNWQPPPVRDLTDLTGSSKNEHRRTVFLGYAVNRAIIPMVFIALGMFGVAAIFFVPTGGAVGVLISIAVAGAGFMAYYVRIKKAMNQRAWKAIKDWVESSNGAIFIDGYPVLEPQLVWHQPIWLDRDPDEMRDIDVVYVTSKSRTRKRQRRTWMNTDLTASDGKTR